MKIAIQGLAGCFHHEAATRMYGKSTVIVECKDFESVFDVVESGTADMGVVAIENTLQGTINQVYRLLLRHKLSIVSEHFLNIEQCLIARRPISLQDLANSKIRIYSMFPSFAQTEHWTKKHLPNAEKVDYYDNAAAVKKIMQDEIDTELAIAGRQAAELYGATVIAAPIQDDSHNTTRFIGISRNSLTEPGDQTSIILTTDNTPGSLHRALGVFEANGIDLRSLTSYPIPGDKRHYMFYIDYDKGEHEPSSVECIAALKAQDCKVQVLGTYKSHKNLD